MTAIAYDIGETTEDEPCGESGGTPSDEGNSVFTGKVAAIGTCHKCGGSLRRGRKEIASLCKTCGTRFHSIDCGNRLQISGYPGMSEQCPKCSGLCTCVGGRCECHAGNVRRKRIVKAALREQDIARKRDNKRRVSEDEEPSPSEAEHSLRPLQAYLRRDASHASPHAIPREETTDDDTPRSRAQCIPLSFVNDGAPSFTKEEERLLLSVLAQTNDTSSPKVAKDDARAYIRTVASETFGAARAKKAREGLTAGKKHERDRWVDLPGQRVDHAPRPSGSARTVPASKRRGRVARRADVPVGAADGGCGG